MSKRLKRPRDPIELGKTIGDIATKLIDDLMIDNKNKASVEFGILGGSKGGHRRAKNLSPERRSEIARQAALARWKNKGRS